MFYWQDVRYALRLLARSPVFTALTIAVLGGGLGLSVFTFSFLHAAMLRPIPVAEGDRVVRISQARGSSSGGLDAADLAALRPSVTTLGDVGVWMGRELVVGAEGRRRVVQASVADWRIFETTRVRPALGRGFRPDDQAPGAEPVVVLGDRAWRVVFGADSGIVDRVVTIDGAPTRVIGVMPKGYGFPIAAEAWVPFPGDVFAVRERGRFEVGVYARLAPGATIDEARAELAVLFERLRTADPVRAAEAGPVPRLEVETFPLAQIGEQAPLVLGVLNLLATLILLLACVNVVNLLLARANERARETAVRLALGATRSRLVVQSLWESVILCLAGGALATVLAAWGLDAIDAWARAHMERNLVFWWSWKLDRTGILAAGAFVTAALAVLGGAVSARVTSVRFNEVLQDGGSRSGGRREGRIARALVVTQVATVTVLMFFGVMSAIVAHRAANVDLGYDTRNLLTAGVDLPADRFATREPRSRFFASLSDELSRRPAVDGLVLRAPLADAGSDGGVFEVEGVAAPVAGEARRAYVQAVHGPLETLGIDLAQGRALAASDRPDALPVAVVSRALAARWWPGESPIGRRLRLTGLGETAEWRTVVGVVGDVLHGNPISRDRSAEAIYVPLAQSDAGGAAVVFRHRGDPVAAQAALHETVAALDPLVVPGTVQTFDEVLAQMALVARSVSRLFGACFGFALLLAVSGTYGLMARSIGQRTREIGVRRALGATDALVVRLLLGQGGRQLGVGALVALPAMLAVGVGFTHYVPVGLALTLSTGMLVSASIAGVVLAATWVPTRRALAVQPQEALRHE